MEALRGLHSFACFRVYSAASHVKGVATTPSSPHPCHHAGAGKPSYELLAAKAELLMRGGPGLLPDPATAAECLYQAAQQATDARRGKRAAQFFELAAKAEGMVGEEQGDAS